MSFDQDSRPDGFQDTTLQPAPKRIVICCDGTWQSSVTNVDNVPSNITRIARYLLKVGKDTKGEQWQQLVYYDAGIGTGASSMEAAREGMTGSGFVGNVIEAYNFIVLNYNPGDQIFCFGFSRGAYTARAVAGLVTDIGIVKPRDMQDFPELYRTYQQYKDSNMFRKSKAWREWVSGVRLFDAAQKDLPEGFRQSPYQWKKRPHGAAPESTRWVEAVGVFDTVGSLGVPDVEGLFRYTINFLAHKIPAEEFGFHNVALSPYIKHAYHAMALDEHRKPFDTTMWHLYPGDGTARTHQPVSELKEKLNQLRDTDGTHEAEIQKAWENLVDAEMHEELKGSNSKLKQVWFPGHHINIGGGSNDLLKDKLGDLEQISTITLAWMVEQLKEHLAFELNAMNLWNQDRFLLLQPFIQSHLDDHAKYKNNWLVKKINNMLAKDKNDPWNDGNKTRFKVLATEALQDWATGPFVDEFENMKKAGSKYRTPGEYRDKNAPKDVRGGTEEEIHPTVWYRMRQLGNDYQPVPLKGFERKQKESPDGVSYEWVKGSVRIPESRIDGMQSIERSCLVGDTAKKSMGGLDKEYSVDSSEAKALDGPLEAPGSRQNHGFQPNQGF
ncbi:unnamed protein product [Alternaria alternata]